jgi:pyruvate/2-oxoglutarate dehydrogenase complex dihydrolipoamide acyltransferase (E2) component
MAIQAVIMPKLGAYTDDVLLAGWLVGEGDEVAAGAAVFELETEKTTAEVEADVPGWVHRLVAAGELVPIGTTVGYIAETRDEYDTLAGPDEAAGGSDGEAANPFLGYLGHGGGTSVAHAAMGSAAEAPPAMPAFAATARPRRAEEPGSGPLVSPRARALLKELGFTLEDAREITASGPGGRIVDRDVSDWAESRSAQAPPISSVEPGELTVRTAIPLRGRRRTIATRMVSSLQTAAQLTSVIEIDVKPLVGLRARLNEAGATPRIGITALVVKLVAAALREHPSLNARVTETDIELLAEINVAVAVETPDGVVAPVIAGADRLSVEEINTRIVELASRARESSLSPGELAGGTFTVSNGGIHPVDITTAILNPPQCGILWIGRIRDRAVVVGDGAIAVRPTLQACLTFDHRAVDGGPAAEFLATFESFIARLPELPS